MRSLIFKEKIDHKNVDLYVHSKCKYCSAIWNEQVPIIAKGFTKSHILSIHQKIGVYYLIIKCPYCESLNLRLFNIKRGKGIFENGNEYYAVSFKQKVHKPNDDNDFPEKIKKISPRFIDVYNQSFKAEKNGLNELFGMGYRKALEILVKDYAIQKFPKDKNQIMKNSLQAALKKIDTHEIQVLGQVATKIGNDETHYYRKHEWKVSELKSYIEAIVMFIISDLSYSEADERLQEDRSQKH